MRGKTTDQRGRECSLADRIVLTLHSAKRKGFVLYLSHLSKVLIYREAEIEKVRLMPFTIPPVSYQPVIYCLRGCENPETGSRLLCKRVTEMQKTYALHKDGI